MLVATGVPGQDHARLWPPTKRTFFRHGRYLYAPPPGYAKKRGLLLATTYAGRDRVPKPSRCCSTSGSASVLLPKPGTPGSDEGSRTEARTGHIVKGVPIDVFLTSRVDLESCSTSGSASALLLPPHTQGLYCVSTKAVGCVGGNTA